MFLGGSPYTHISQSSKIQIIQILGVHTFYLWYLCCIFWESHICHILILNLFFTEYLEFRPEHSDFGRWEKIIMEPSLSLWVVVLLARIRLKSRLRYQSLTKGTRPTARWSLTLASWPWAMTTSPLTNLTWSAGHHWESRDRAPLAPPGAVGRHHAQHVRQVCIAGLWLVETDHVTWILTSDWSDPIGSKELFLYYWIWIHIFYEYWLI